MGNIEVLPDEGFQLEPRSFTEEPMMLNEVEYYEYECGRPCTTNGCLGHETDIPIAVCIGGVRFVVDGYDGGDFPSSNQEETQRVKDVVAYLEKTMGK